MSRTTTPGNWAAACSSKFVASALLLTEGISRRKGDFDLRVCDFFDSAGDLVNLVERLRTDCRIERAQRALELDVLRNHVGVVSADDLAKADTMASWLLVARGTN